jgi:hypothetical protein
MTRLLQCLSKRMTPEVCLLPEKKHIHASSIAMTVCDLLPVDWPREQLRELLRFVNFFD